MAGKVEKIIIFSLSMLITLSIISSALSCGIIDIKTSAPNPDENSGEEEPETGEAGPEDSQDTDGQQAGTESGDIAPTDSSDSNAS